MTNQNKSRHTGTAASDTAGCLILNYQRPGETLGQALARGRAAFPRASMSLLPLGYGQARARRSAGQRGG